MHGLLLLQRLGRGRRDLLVLCGLDKVRRWLMQLLQTPLLLHKIGASMWLLELGSLGGPTAWPGCLLVRGHTVCFAWGKGGECVRMHRSGRPQVGGCPWQGGPCLGRLHSMHSVHAPAS